MQSIDQHYYRETEEPNSNGCKLLVKKDAILDSLDVRERSCSSLEKKPTINSWTRNALCNSMLSYERIRWKFEHVIRNSIGDEIWSIYNDNYFEIWTFFS